MDAVVSGQARTALIIDNGNLLSFNLDSPENLIQRRESDIRYIFGEATDLRFIENTNRKYIFDALQTDYCKACALDLALMLLDKDIQETKPLIAETLEKCFLETDIDDYLDSIFYSHPLPKNADTKNALNLCKKSFPTTYLWLSSLVDRQESISQVKKIWDSLDTDVFRDDETLINFEKTFAQEGIFRVLVQKYHHEEEIDLFVLEDLFNFEVIVSNSITSLPDYELVLWKLLESFNQSLANNKDTSGLAETLKEETKSAVENKGILRRLAEGDETAADDFIEQYEKRIDLMIRRNLSYRDREEAGYFLIHEILFKIWKMSERLGEIKSESAFILMLVKLSLYKILRDNRRTRREYLKDGFSNTFEYFSGKIAAHIIKNIKNMSPEEVFRHSIDDLSNRKFSDPVKIITKTDKELDSQDISIMREILKKEDKSKRIKP